MSATEKTGGFSEAEKQAMRERAAELKAEKGGKKKAEMEKAALDAIAAMPDEDRLIAERIHALVLERGVPAWVGGMLELGVGRAAALAVAALPGCVLPTDLGPSSRYVEHDVVEPFELTGEGMLAVPTGPGIGRVPDEERLDEVAVARRVVGG